MNCPCGKPLTGRQRLFCSVKCRNSANGKKSGGHNRKRVWLNCASCGRLFDVPPSRETTARACSRKCLGELQSAERRGRFGLGSDNPTWKSGISTYRQHRKDACERCGATTNLLVHHKDENRENNELENLETLCKRCHQLHHRCWENLPNA